MVALQELLTKDGKLLFLKVFDCYLLWNYHIESNLMPHNALAPTYSVFLSRKKHYFTNFPLRLYNNNTVERLFIVYLFVLIGVITGSKSATAKAVPSLSLCKYILSVLKMLFVFLMASGRTNYFDFDACVCV